MANASIVYDENFNLEKFNLSFLILHYYYYINGICIFPIFYNYDYKKIFIIFFFKLILGKFLSLGQFKSKHNNIKPRWRW